MKMIHIVILLFGGLVCHPLTLLAEEVRVIGIVEMHRVAERDKNGQLTGPLIDYWEHKICPVLKIRCEFQSINFARMLRGVEEGTVDVLTLVTKNSERAVFGYFPKTPVWQSHLTFVVPKTSPITEITHSSQLYGLTIGYAIDMHIPSFLRDSQLKFEFVGGVDWAKQNLIKLRRKWIDVAYYPSATTANSALMKVDFSDEFKSIYMPKPFLYYDIFSKNSVDASNFFKRYVSLIEETGIAENLQRYVKERDPGVR